MNRDADYRKVLDISSGIWWVGCGGRVGGWVGGVGLFLGLESY